VEEKRRRTLIGGDFNVRTGEGREWNRYKGEGNEGEEGRKRKSKNRKINKDNKK